MTRNPKLSEAVVLAVMLALSVSACSTTPTTGTATPAPPIEPEAPEARQEFDVAIELLEAGDWRAAREELRLVQAEHAGDQAAELAEVYIARTFLEDLDEQFERGESSEFAEVDPQVFSLLQPLAESARVDERVRWGAKAYLGVAYALEGRSEEAVDALADYPGPSMSPVVLEGDQFWTWPLIAEGLARGERHEAALVAWGEFYTHLLEEIDGEPADEGEPRTEGIHPGAVASLDDTPTGQNRVNSPRAELATTRAFELAGELSEEEIHRALSGESPLVRSAGAWGLIHDRLGESDSVDEETIETMQTVFNDVSGDFVTVGAADRASELSVALGSVAGPERLVIGALVPLSGPNRSVGRQALSGMLLAKRAFHAAGEPSITLAIEDSTDDVVAAYRRLVDRGVAAVIGPLSSEAAEQLVEVVGEHRVPLMTLSADRLQTARQQAAGSETEEVLAGSRTEEGDESNESDESAVESRVPLYRNFVDSIAEARAAAYMAFERLGDRRAVVIHPDMGYGRMMSRAFAEEFRRRGGQVLDEIEYPRDSSNYVDLAEQVASLQPEAVFLPDTGPKVAELSAFLAQAQVWGADPAEPRPRDNRVWVHYLGTSLWQAPILVEQAGDYVDGAVIPAWYSPLFSDNETRQFTTSYEAIYGNEPDRFAVFAYDSVERIRALLLDRGATEPREVEEALQRGDFQQGATGRYYFGSDGEPQRELRYVTIDDEAWAIYEDSVMTPLDGRAEFDSQFEEDRQAPLEERQTSEGEDGEAVDEP